MKKFLSLLICLVLLMGLLPTTAFATGDSQIKTLNIKIADPVASYTPGSVLGMDSNIDDPMFHIPSKIATWEDTFFHTTLTKDDEFVAGLPYKVTIHLCTMVRRRLQSTVAPQRWKKSTTPTETLMRSSSVTNTQPCPAWSSAVSW